MRTSSTFLHELLERIQKNIITVLAKMKTGQVAKRVIMLDQKPLSVSDPRKVLKLPFLKVRFCIMLHRQSSPQRLTAKQSRLVPKHP